MAPLRVGIEEPAAVEHADVGLPERLAVHIPRGKHADRAEARYDAPAIGRRRRARLTGLRVTLHFRHALVGVALPENFSRGLVEAVDLPGVLRKVIHRRDVTVEPGSERLVAGAADSRDHEDTVAPNHRAGGRDAGNRRFPADVLLSVDVPFDDRALPVAVSSGVVAAEPGPVARRGSNGGFDVRCRRRGCRGGAAARRGRRGRRLGVARRAGAAGAVATRVHTCGVFPIDRHGTLDHPAAPLEVDREPFPFGDAEARWRRRDERHRHSAAARRRQRQLVAVQRDCDRRAGVLVAIAADV